MRKDVLDVLKQYKHEILKEYQDYGFMADWWHYLDDTAINVHDYEETGNIVVNLYDWFDDVGTVDMQDTYTFTFEEFKNL